MNKKLKKLLSHDFMVIYCIGETLEDRKTGKTNDVLARQLKDGLEGVSDLQGLMIAYEPIWAIGTGEAATPEQAGQAHHHIRNWFETNYDKGSAEKLQILYGGSVKPSNLATLLSQKDIDGGLIGGASLEASSFKDLIDTALKHP